MQRISKLATGDLRLDLVSKSSDGGLHWSNPVTLFEGTDQLTTTDKPSITADPTDARFVHAVWNVLANGNRGQAMEVTFCPPGRRRMTRTKAASPSAASVRESEARSSLSATQK